MVGGNQLQEGNNELSNNGTFKVEVQWEHSISREYCFFLG